MSDPLTNAYVKCADQGGTCTFDGTKSVAYYSVADKSKIKYRVKTNSVLCDNRVFNDPDTKNAKECTVTNIPSPQLNLVNDRYLNDFYFIKIINYQNKI